MHDICLFVIGSKSQLQIHYHESHKDRKKIRETLTWSNTGIDSFFGSEKKRFPSSKLINIATSTILAISGLP
jgi:hypothetical protein